MLIPVQDIKVSIKYGDVEITVSGNTAGAKKEDLRNMFERALEAVYFNDR